MKNKTPTFALLILSMMLLTITSVSAQDYGNWTDLTATDAGDWVGTSSIGSTAYDTSRGIVYTCMGTGKIGYFNLSSNEWIDLSTTDAGNWVGASNVARCFYDNVTDVLWTGGSNGVFGYYNITDNTWYDLRTADPGNWVGTTSTGSMLMMRFDETNRLIFTSYGANNKFGVYNMSDGVLYDLSASDTDNWMANYKINRQASDGNNLYISPYTVLATGPNNGFGVYNISSGVMQNKSGLIPWTNETQYIGAFGILNGKVYIGIGSNVLSAGIFGYYDPATDTFTDLRNTAPSDWAGTADLSVIRIDYTRNLVYTIGYFCNDNGARFGVYDPNTNVWTDLSIYDNDWLNTSNNTWATCNDNAIGQPTDAVMDEINNKLYMISYNGWLGVYLPAEQRVIDLSTTDADGWMNNMTSQTTLAENSIYHVNPRILTDGKLLTSGITAKFGMYIPPITPPAAINYSYLANNTIWYFTNDQNTGTGTLDLVQNKTWYDAVTPTSTNASGILGSAMDRSPNTDNANNLIVNGTDYQCPTTVGFWFNTSDEWFSGTTKYLGALGCTVGGVQLSTGPNGGYQIQVLMAGDYSNYYSDYAGVTIPSYNDGTWHQLIFTLNQTNNVSMFYYDGVGYMPENKNRESGWYGSGNLISGAEMWGHPSTAGDYDVALTWDEFFALNQSVNQSEVDFLYANKTPTTEQQYPYIATQTQNSPPTIDSFSPINLTPSIILGQTQLFTTTTSDVDGQTLSYLWLVDGVDEVYTQNFTGDIWYMPESIGIHNITFIVSDGIVNVSKEWTLNVTEVSNTISEFNPQNNTGAQARGNSCDLGFFLSFNQTVNLTGVSLETGNMGSGLLLYVNNNLVGTYSYDANNRAEITGGQIVLPTDVIAVLNNYTAGETEYYQYNVNPEYPLSSGYVNWLLQTTMNVSTIPYDNTKPAQHTLTIKA